MSSGERNKKIRWGRLLFPPLVLTDMADEGYDELVTAGRSLGLTQAHMGLVMLLAIATFVGWSALGAHGLGGMLRGILPVALGVAVGCIICWRQLVGLLTRLHSMREATPFIVVPEERDGLPGWGIYDRRKSETFQWRAARPDAVALAQHLNQILAAHDGTTGAG